MPGAIHVATLSLSLANSTFATVSAVNVFVGDNSRWKTVDNQLIGIEFWVNQG